MKMFNPAYQAKPRRTLYTISAMIVAPFLLTRAPAQTWQTVDDFTYPNALNTDALCVALDPAGNVFVGGWFFATSPVFDAGALLQKSSDGGASWSLADDFAYAGTGAPQYWGVASDSSGHLYAVGREGNQVVWFVRQSLDGGQTWNTVDGFAGGWAKAVTTDLSGSVYSVGYVERTGLVTNKNGSTTSFSTNTWLVRKGTNLGSSWSTVDSFSTNAFCRANAVLAHATRGVFVAGACSNGWLTRRSLDGGSTWTTVDQAIAGEARAIGADDAGTIYVAGNSSAGHWLIRKTQDAGNSWSTADDYYPCVTVTNSIRGNKISTSTTCYTGQANGFAVDSRGNPFAVGNVNGQYVVRENAGGNTAWQTVDVQPGHATAIAADGWGRVYVTGGYSQNGVAHWIVRKN